MAERQKLSIPLVLIKYSFSLVGLLIGLAIVAAAYLLFDMFDSEIANSPVPFSLGITAVIITFGTMLVLDKSATLKSKLQRERFNPRWLIILPAALAFGIVTFAAYAIPAQVNIEYLEMTDLDDPATRNFVVYFATFVILLLAGFFLYFSMKNLRPSMRVHKIKFPAFAVSNVAVLSLIAVIVVMFIAPAVNQVPTRFIDSYAHDDGPWVTWNGDPSTSACVSWLTSARRETTLNIGTTQTNMSISRTGIGNAFLHKVYLTGLVPNTTYYYTIPVSFSQAHASTIFSFRTAPVTQRAFTFTVSGDKQPSSGTAMRHFNGAVVDGIIAQDPDFATMVGDYASNGDYISDWHYTLESLARLGGTTPLALAIGNHDHGNMNGQNFVDMFSYNYDNVTRGKYFAFNYSNAHFLVIDSIALDGSFSNEQLAWIEADLAAANGSVEWKFAFFHYSILSSGDGNMNFGLQAKLVPLFDKYRVDAAFYGHDHFYEHYNYTYGNENLVHDASHTWTHAPVQYFCTGGGGANLEATNYGLLSRSPTNVMRTWYNLTLGNTQDITYYKNPWNASSAYTGGLDDAPGNTIYYQDPAKAVYQEEITHFGYTYGENSYHFMLVEVDGNTCTITARHPDGTLMAGPGGVNPQRYVLTHA